MRDRIFLLKIQRRYLHLRIEIVAASASAVVARSILNFGGEPESREASRRAKTVLLRIERVGVRARQKLSNAVEVDAVVITIKLSSSSLLSSSHYSR